jgi:multicomponent Na+:H+ antiporter subunit F
MAGVNVWMIAAATLLLALVPCLVVIQRGKMADGLAAFQLAGTVTILAVLLLAVGFHRATVADIPLALAVLSFPSSILFAHFLERWL